MRRTTSPTRFAPPRRPSRARDSLAMPELPDVEVYREALAARVIGQPLRAVQLRNPFVLRTAVPPLDAVVGKTVRDVSRIGKRIVLAFDGEFFLVLHLMI